MVGADNVLEADSLHADITAQRLSETRLALLWSLGQAGAAHEKSDRERERDERQTVCRRNFLVCRGSWWC